jgi:outer membrane lipoprotein SlyB
MNVETGDIVAVRDVEVSGRNTIIGVGGGGLVGGAAASGIGSGGVGTAVASAAGAVGGAIIGEATEEAATRKRAQEITIKLGNGGTVAVVQKIGADGAFTIGEHVQVLQGMETIVRRF